MISDSTGPSVVHDGMFVRVFFESLHVSAKAFVLRVA